MAEDEEKVEPTAAKKGMTIKKMVIAWIPLFVIQLVISYVVVAKFFKPKMNPETQMVEAEEVDKDEDVGTIGEMYLMEDVIVNPKGTNGARFLSIGVGFECESQEYIQEIEKRDVQIRNYLISLLSDRTIEQVDDGREKELLRGEIFAQVDSLIAIEGLRNVYFQSFILQ